MQKMTHKEHVARAMLMGLEYDWRDGTYCNGMDVFGGPSNQGMIDCVSLEKISTDSLEARMVSNRIGNLSPPDWETPLWETPWARMDDDDKRNENHGAEVPHSEDTGGMP